MGTCALPDMYVRSMRAAPCATLAITITIASVLFLGFRYKTFVNEFRIVYIRIQIFSSKFVHR